LPSRPDLADPTLQASPAARSVAVDSNAAAQLQADSGGTLASTGT